MAINYLKNVMKSVTYAAMDITGEFTPNTKEFAETNKEFTTATFSALKNPKSFVAKQITSIQESKVYKAVDYGVKNLFEDLRTGNYYNKARKERDELALAGFDTNWDDLSEFGIEDDWEKNISSSDSSAEITAGDMKIVEAIEGSNEASTNATVNAVIATSQREVQTSRVNTGILYNQNERLFGGIHKDITILGGTLDKMHAMQSAALQNMDKNMSEFFTQETKLSQERNRILQEMLDLQKQYYQGANKKQDTKKSTQIRWGDININGMPDMDAYFKAVKKNISNQVSSLGFGGFGEDSNMLAQFMISPMEHVVKFAVNGIIPATIKAASKELDATLSGLFGNMIARLSNAKEANDGGGILGIVAKFLGINTSVNRNIDTSKYEKGPIPFDGITRKAIIDVIPTHLRRIEAALTGNQEEMFDYQSGKWVKVSSIKKQLDDVRKNAVNRGTEEIYSAMQPGIRAVKAGMTKKDDAESFDRAIEQFRQFLAAKRGIFNPKLSADANDIDRTLYPDLYKHYSKIKTVFGNVGVIESKDRNGNVTKRYTRQSVKMNVSSNVLNALEEEERFYREAESSADSIYSRFASVGGNYDKHGKYDKKNDKFNPFGRLNQDKDELGNTVFNYLQNINKELQWMRINIPNIVQMPSRGGRGKNKYSKTSTAKLTSINDINLRNPSFRVETPMDRIREEEDYKKRALSKIAKDKDGTADLRMFEQDELEYLLQLQDIMRNASVEEYKSEIEGYNANTLSKFMDKHFYKTNIKSRKDVEAAIKKADKEGKKTNEVKFDEKEESFFKKIINRVTNGGETILGGILGASADTFTNLLYAADKAIYDMMFKAELRDSEDGKKYDGFMNAMVGKMTSTFKSIKESFFKEFVDPLKERLGIGDDFKDRFKDSLKNAGSRLWTSFKNANAEVYSPIIDDIKNIYNRYATPKNIKKMDRRADISKRMSTLNKATSRLDPELMKAMDSMGMSSLNYADIDELRNDIIPKLVEEYLENSDNLTADDLTKDNIDMVLSHLTKKNNTEAILNIAKANNIDISSFDKESDMTDAIKKHMHTRIDKRKSNINLASHLGKDAKNQYNKDNLYNMNFFSSNGNYESKKKEVLANARLFGVEEDIKNRIKEEESKITKKYQNKEDGEYWAAKEKDRFIESLYSEIYTKFHAKGTTGRPFTGLTTLTKGEGLISSSGVGVVPKTGIYNVSTPTHIINTEDMHSITGGPRVSVQQALGKEKLAAKAAGYTVASHADGTDRVKGKGADAELKIDDKNSIKGRDILQQAKLYLPEAAGGGLIGGILSLVLGLAGGPLVGAALGAGGSLIASSDSLKDKLFGKAGEDGKRDGGIVPKSIMNAYNKYFPDMAKYGLAGIIPGLITPLGPIGGILAGAAFGFIKNNEHFTDKYFGENGKLHIRSKEQQILKKLFPAAAKGGLIGGIAGMFLPSPFGFMGNAVIGSVLGMMGTTDEFKNMILGEEDASGERYGGLVGALKDAVSPFTKSLKTAGEKLTDAIDEHVLTPLSNFINPAIHALPKMLGAIPRMIGEKLEEHTSKIGKTFSTFIRNVLHKPIGLASKLLSPITSAITKAISVPGRALTGMGNKFREYNIKRGDSVDMSQMGALEWMIERGKEDQVSDMFKASAYMGTDRKRVKKDKHGNVLTDEDGNELTYDTMSAEDGADLVRLLNSMNKNKKQAKSSFNSANDKLNKALTKFKYDDGSGLSPSLVNDILATARAGGASVEDIAKMIQQRGGLTSKQFDNLWNGTGKDDKGLKGSIINALNAKETLDTVNTMDGGQILEQAQSMLSKFGINDFDISNERQRNEAIRILKDRQIELAANPNKKFEDEVQKREDDNHENITRIADTASEILKRLDKILSGEDEEIAQKHRYNEDYINLGGTKVKNEYDRRVKNIKYSGADGKAIDEDGLDALSGIKSDRKRQRVVNEYTADVINNTKNFRNADKIFGKRPKKIEQNLRVDKNIIKLLSKEVISNISRMDSYRINNIRKALIKEGIKNAILNIYGKKDKNGNTILLSMDDIDILSRPGKAAQLEKNCLILLQIYKQGGDEGKKIYDNYATLQDVAEITIDDRALLRDKYRLNWKEAESSDRNAAIRTGKKAARGAGKVVKGAGGIAADVVGFGAKAVHGTVKATVEGVKIGTRMARNAKAGVYSSKYNAPIESDNESPEVEQHGIGTALLGGLLNVGKAAAKGAVSLAGKGISKVGQGIKSIFTGKDKESRDGANAGLLATLGSGILNMVGGKGAKQDGGELDETDKKGDGKDAVHVGNGDIITVERTQDGSIEPDTSDSKTKAIMNKLNLKERALEKLQAAQLKASEVIQKTFDTSDVKESKGGKLGWFALLLGGGLLLKSGILQKLFGSVIEPLWTNHLKPFLSGAAETITTKLSGIWTDVSTWFTQTAVPFITENMPRWIGIMAANVIKSIPGILKGLLEGFSTSVGTYADVITGNRNGAGTKTEVDANNLAETRGSDFETGMTDENGNKLTVADIQNGNYKEIYNAQGIKGTVGEDGGITFEDDSIVGSSGAEATANSSVRAFAKSIGSGKKNKLLDLADRGASKLMKSKKGLIRKFAGLSSKISFTAPIKGAEKLGLGLHDRWNNYINNKFDQVARNLFDKEAQKMGGNLTSKEGKELWKRINRGEILDDFDKSNIGIKYHKAKDVVTDVKGKIDDVVDDGKGIFNSIKDKYNKAKEVAGAPKRFVRDQVDKIKGAISESKLGDIYHNAKDTVTGKIDSVKTGIKNKASDLKDKAIQGVKNKASSAKTKMAEGITSIKEGFMNKASNAKDKIVGVFKKTGKEAAEETAEKGVKGTVGKATSKIADFVGSVAKKIKELVSGLFENNTVVKKLKDVAESLGVKDSGTWIKKIKSSVDDFLGNAVENACKKVGIDICKKVASKIFAWATIILDFTTGMDQAEAILGVRETSIVEELVAGLVNAIVNASIIFSIFPGVSSIAQFIYKLIFDNAEEKMAEADDEYKKYVEETGSTLTKEEYLKRQYSYTGKLGGWIEDKWRQFKGKVGDGWNWVKDKAGKVGESVSTGWNWVKDKAGGIKDKIAGWISGNANGTIDISEVYANADGTSSNSVLDAAKNIMSIYTAPIDLIKKQLNSVSDMITKSTENGFNNDKESNNILNKAREGKINIFSKEFWKVSGDSKDTSFGGSLKRAISNLNKIMNFPMLMIKSSLENLSTDISSVGEIVTGQSSGSSSSNGSSSGSSLSSSSSSSSSKSTTFTGKVKNFFSSAASKIKSFFGFGTGKVDGEYEYGTGGYSKQIDSSIAGIRFNSAADSEYQTIGDSGCGPAAAVNALESIYGRGGKAVVDAAKFAINHGYKETDGGTRPEFFTDYFNSNGLGSQISYNRRQIENNINSGMPTVIMGKDPKGTSPSTPFGRTSHYVTVTGTDGRGNAIVQDPESRYDNQLYPIKNLMNKTTLGVSAYGKGYSNKRHRSGFGKRFGRGIWGLGRFGRGKSKIIFIGDSRTVGMKNAVGSNDHIWSCEVGKGLSWMKSTGVPNIEQQINQDTAIVILMGVNDCADPGIASIYATYINKEVKEWTKSGAEVYYVSVNPVDESKYEGPITNSDIDDFNSTLKSILDKSISWIDTNSAIKNSFKTSDGLHYDDDTYKNIYNIITTAVSAGVSVEVANGTLTSTTTSGNNNESVSTDNSVISTFSNIIMQSKAGKALQLFLGGNNNSSNATTTNSTSPSSSTASGGTFPKYNLTEAQKLGIANIVGHEQPGKTGYLAEASLIANRTDISGDDKATPENIVETVTSGWFADGKNRYNNPGSPDPDAIKAVEEVIINGKRTLPRYINEHDYFGDIASVTNNGTSIADVKDRSKYKQHVSVIKNHMGSTYTFYEFPNDQSDPFGYIGTENRSKWGENHYNAEEVAAGFGKNYKAGKGKFGRSKGRFGRGESSQEVWSYATNTMGLTDAGAAGLLGNMYYESGIDPKKTELSLLKKSEYEQYNDDSYTSAVDSGEISKEKFLHPLGGSTQFGYGLVQWTSPGIKEGLYDNAKSKNVSIGDLQNQCETLNQQFTESYSDMMNILKTTNDVKEASNAVLLKFERPADQSESVQEKRATKAQEYYNKFGGQAGTNSNNQDNASSASDSVISILSSIISNSKAGKALQLFLGGSQQASSSTTSNSTTTVGGPMAQRVIQIAQGEVGYKEKSGDSNLDDKEADASSGNYTKYWRDLNGPQGEPWCNAFVSWVMEKAGVPQSIFKKNYACTQSLSDQLSLGSQKVEAPNTTTGDLLYKREGGSDTVMSHIGIVEKTSGNTVSTIEGNSGQMVTRRDHSTSDSKYIYVRPAYEGGSPTSSNTVSSNTDNSNESEISYDEDYSTLGSNGYKPLSKYGRFKESIYGKGSGNYRKVSERGNGKYTTTEISEVDMLASRIEKNNSRKHVYNKYPTYGRGTAVVEPKFHAAGTTDTVANSKLLNTIISILVTIAENTDKLNMIVSILNDKLNINITESDISKAKEDSQSLKSRLSEAINANSNLSRFNSYADNVVDSSINSIISAMNAIASE